MTIFAGLVAFIPVVLPIISWILRKSGQSEEAIKQFEDSVKAVQAKRADATKPADDEAAALDDLRKREAENDPKL